MTSEPTVPRIIAVSERFRRELLAGEREAATRMVNAYGQVWSRLYPRLDALQQQIAAREVAGQEVNPDWLRRQVRYTELLQQIVGELGRFSAYADLEVQAGQQRFVAAAIGHAEELTANALPPGLTLRDLAEVGIAWNRLPAEAVQDLVGRLGDGSPLRTLLDNIPGGVAAGVSDALVNGLAQGWGPRKTADVARRETGMGLAQALKISRTESLQAYRTAARRQYQANPRIVKGWRRHAAKNGRTCLACLMLDGKRYQTQEDMDDHPNGRCALVPETISYEDLGIPVKVPPIEWERGQQWFERQPEGVQAEMMGSSLYGAWRDGKLKLEQLPKKHDDPTWGPSWTVSSLRDLGIDWRSLKGDAA